jgi:uncharacterized protein (DUF2147 family)
MSIILCIFAEKTMKKILLLIAILLSTGQTVYSQRADDICGYYLCTDPFTDEKSQLQIYSVGNGTYEGVVTWIENPKLRHYVGLICIKDLHFNADKNEWQDAKFINPKRKGNYRAYMSFVSDNQLKIRGYWGISVLGKTLYWTKESKKRAY